MATVPVLRTKAGCAFQVIAPGGFRLLAALDSATKVMGRDLTITSGTNDHAGVSRHLTGEAYDVSVKGLTVPEIVKLKSYLSQVLGSRFTVLYETPTEPTDATLKSIAYVNPDATGVHLHAQVRKGTPYPPLESHAV